MLATSPIFEKIYSLELAVSEQGMPFWMYNDWLNKYGYQKSPPRVTDHRSTESLRGTLKNLETKVLNLLKLNQRLKQFLKIVPTAKHAQTNMFLECRSKHGKWESKS